MASSSLFLPHHSAISFDDHRTRSSFFGFKLPSPSSSSSPSLPHLLPPPSQIRSEKADLWQLLGGRGLPGGELGLIIDKQQKSLFGDALQPPSSSSSSSSTDHGSSNDASEGSSPDPGAGGSSIDALDGAFEKELMGLTGGFPGGETGLQSFVAKNPPPSKVPQGIAKLREQLPKPGARPKAPPPPLLMPGMTVRVKNSRHPFYMYSGIVQRVSDGNAGVLLEGGNWDKLLTFSLEDLERTTKGPPMSNPKSAVLEKITSS